MSKNPELSEDDAAKLIAMHINAKKPKDYGYYRVSSLRDISGGKKLRPKNKISLKHDLCVVHSVRNHKISGVFRKNNW